MKSCSVLLPMVLVLSACAGSSPNLGVDPEDAERKMIGLEEKFDRFDTDGNGYLTSSELKSGLATVDVPEVPPGKVSTVIEFYDANKDGRISLRETQAGSAAGPGDLLKKLE